MSRQKSPVFFQIKGEVEHHKSVQQPASFQSLRGRQLSHHGFEGKRIKLSVSETDGEITVASCVINDCSQGWEQFKLFFFNE